MSTKKYNRFIEICENIINGNKDLWDNFFNYSIDDFRNKLTNISHDSKYHDESIKEHIEQCVSNTEFLYENKKDITERQYNILDLVQNYHDIGKPFVKVNGNFYLHDNISAGIFYYLFKDKFKDKDFLRDFKLKEIDLFIIMDIIQNHMRMNSFKIGSNKSEGKIQKLFRNLGQELSKLYIYFYEIDSKSREPLIDNDLNEIDNKIEYLNELHYKTFSSIRIDDFMKVYNNEIFNDFIDLDKLKDITNKSNNKLIIVPIGIQGSGKTKLRNELMEYNTYFEYLSLDELRNNEDIYNNDLFETFEKEIKKFKKSLTRILILDNTNVNEKSRKKIMDTFGYYKESYDILYLIFDNDLEECYNYMKSRKNVNDIHLFHLVRTLGMLHHPLLDYDERNCGNSIITNFRFK